MSKTVYQVLKELIPGISRKNWHLEGIGAGEKLADVPEDKIFAKVFGKKGHEPQRLAKREWDTLAEAGLTDITVNVDGELFIIPVSGEFFEDMEETMSKEKENKTAGAADNTAAKKSEAAQGNVKPGKVNKSESKKGFFAFKELKGLPMEDTIDMSLKDTVAMLASKNKEGFIYFLGEEGERWFSSIDKLDLDSGFSQAAVFTSQGWVRMSEIADDLTYLDLLGDTAPEWAMTSSMEEDDTQEALEYFHSETLGGLIKDMSGGDTKVTFLFKNGVDLDKKETTDEDALVARLHGKVISDPKEIDDISGIKLGDVLDENALSSIVMVFRNHSFETDLTGKKVKVKTFRGTHPATMSSSEQLAMLGSGIGFSRAGMIVPALGF